MVSNRLLFGSNIPHPRSVSHGPSSPKSHMLLLFLHLTPSLSLSVQNAILNTQISGDIELSRGPWSQTLLPQNSIQITSYYCTSKLINSLWPVWCVLCDGYACMCEQTLCCWRYAQLEDTSQQVSHCRGSALVSAAAQMLAITPVWFIYLLQDFSV